MAHSGTALSHSSGTWITWESHRRTQELSKNFGVTLHELQFKGPYLLKIIILSIRTLALVLKIRPKVLVVQNPSIILAALVSFLGHFFNYFLIVDRHSNFKLEKLNSKKLKYKGFHYLSRYSLRRANITVVTNQYLVTVVEKMGGRGFVMPDKFPELPLAKVKKFGVGQHVLYICSFDDDEPVSEVMQAMELLGKDVTLHVTGNNSKASKGLVDTAPENVNFTGFLPESDYQSLLVSVDAVLTLTTMPHTMQCGAYEAVAAGRPLVFGPDEAMVKYFTQGRVVTELDYASIAKALRKALDNGEVLQKESINLKRERDEWWEDNLQDFFGLVK